MEELEIIQYDGDGYKAMVYFEGWRVAFLRYAEHFDKAKVNKMERHLLTDEVFVLLTGEAFLIVGEEKKVCHLEKNKIYNVKKAVWHAVCVSEDAQILIVENADTCKENTEYKEIEQMNDRINKLQGKLIVSCQALPHEPLHSSFIMGRMALAAQEGGAFGIRANTKEDIEEIRKLVNLPVIGIVKRDYESCEVYITPTMKEIDELIEAETEIIAVDATVRSRPGNMTLDEFFNQIKEKYPNQLLMADCSTVEEAIHADELGFDFIGTTMVGYTEQSQGMRIEENNFEILREIVAKVKNKVIAEGNINTPQKAKRVIELGAFCVVVGSIITRPQLITKAFAEALE